MVKRHITEQTIIFFSILKWTGLAVFIGAIVGFAIHFFILAVDGSSSYVLSVPNHIWLLPIGLILSNILVTKFAPDAKGHGTEKVIEAIHKKNGRIEAKVIPVKVLATIVTIATGGSVGKEGPSAQIGSGIASIFSDLAHLNEHDRKKIAICGISAGFAAVFGTPIAGAIFGIEVLYVGKILYDVMLPSLVAGITSFEIVTLLGTTPLRVAIPGLSKMYNFGALFGAGIVFGLMALLFIKSLHVIEHFVDKFKLSPLVKGLVGGAILVFLVQFTGQAFLGLGSKTVELALKGTNVPWYAAIAKILFTDLTLAFGGSGGVIAPTFFIGATAGRAYASIFGLNAQMYSALGMVGVLAAATNAPISSILLASEIFGPVILLPAAIVASLSFLINGHNSIYPSQILAMKKTVSLDVEVGKELSEVTSRLAFNKERVGGRVGYITQNALKS